MTLRISRTSCVRDDPTWPCLMMNDLGIPSERASRAFAPLRWVLVFLRLVISRTRKSIIRKEGYLFVSEAITKYWDRLNSEEKSLHKNKWVGCHHSVGPLRPPLLPSDNQNNLTIRVDLLLAHRQTKSNPPTTAKSEPACKRYVPWLKHGKTSSSSMGSNHWKTLSIPELTSSTTFSPHLRILRV